MIRLFVVVFALSASIIACSMGGRPVIDRSLFKSLFYLDDKTGVAYKKECPSKRDSRGRCKSELVKKPIDLCEDKTFRSLVRERYILVKESDFLN